MIQLIYRIHLSFILIFFNDSKNNKLLNTHTKFRIQILVIEEKKNLKVNIKYYCIIKCTLDTLKKRG